MGEIEGMEAMRSIVIMQTKKPIQKIAVRANLVILGSCSRHTEGIGRERTAMSVARLIAPVLIQAAY